MSAERLDRPRTRARRLATVCGAVALLEVAAVVVLVVALDGRAGFTVVGSFVVPNAPAGLAFVGCGAVIAWYRPRQPVGWLFQVGGLGNLTAALAAAAAYGSVVAGWPSWSTAALVSLHSASWPSGSLLAYPLALLLFPDGRLLSRRWRGAIVLQGVAWIGMLLDQGLHPGAAGMPDGRSALTAVPWASSLGPVWTAVGVVQAGSAVAVVVGLVLRYRRGDEVVRRQLLWLLLSGTAALGSLALFGRGGVSPLVLLTFVLIPVSVVTAILRFDLWDIRLVLSRAVAYAALTVVVVGAYAAVVWLVDAATGARSPGGPVAAAVVAALAFNPARVWLQVRVERLLYGQRSDPIRTVAAVGERLGEGDAGQRVLDTLREALRLPYAAVRAERTVLESGHRVPDTEVVALGHDGRHLGDLVLGQRSGQHHLSRGDRLTVELVAAPLSLALHATALARDLRVSQERLVSAREEERRRIRNDLHDGLGPALTGTAFALDAVENVVGDDPAQARETVRRVRVQVAGAIDEVRRLIEGLRPPVLDQLGLVGAIRAQADLVATRTAGGRLRIHVNPDADGSTATPPALPAAVEVATFRIAAEALHNVARHSGATHAVVRIAVADDLALSVVDNGTGTGAWLPGVGLTSMAERARELGGTCAAGPADGGGRVLVRLPLDVASARWGAGVGPG